VADKQQPGKWRRIPKASFSTKDLSKRMKRVEGATLKHARRFVFKRWNNFWEVRRHIAIWAVTIGIIIGATGLQALWYQQSYRQVANATGGTYAEGVLGPINTLNPIFASSSAEESASSLLFSRLLNYDTTGKLNYDLAESMTIGEDQRTYTLSIRSDAKWHDGFYVRARDVVYTVNLLKNPATRATISGWSDIQVKEIDDRTVQFTLPAVYAAFPHALNFLPILPEHILKDVAPSALRENGFSNKPVGSGPFTLRFIQDLDSQAGRRIIHLAANPQYYKGVPKLERFQLHVYDNSDNIIRALNTSEVNAATDINVADTESINKERYSVDYNPVNNGVYALFNTTTGPLADAKVRQALQAGTDTEALRKSVSDKLPALYLPFISSQISTGAPAAPVYSTERAGQLLDEAGWKLEGNRRMKDGAPLTLTVVTTKNSDRERVLAAMNDQWRKLGVTLTTRIVDPTDRTQNFVGDVLQRRTYDVLLYQLTIGGDPDVYAYWHSSQANSGLNFSNYSNGIADATLDSARTVNDPALRDAKYATFAKQWLNDAPAIGIYQATSQYVYGQNIHTDIKAEKLVTPINRYANVLYWSTGERIVHRTP
jgi:peptide/nickel transport system substrate-binding protein